MKSKLHRVRLLIAVAVAAGCGQVLGFEDPELIARDSASPTGAGTGGANGTADANGSGGSTTSQAGSAGAMEGGNGTAGSGTAGNGQGGLAAIDGALTDAASEADAPVDATSEPTSVPCNSLVNGGSVIMPMVKGGSMPTWLGGTVANGLYFETNVDLYNLATSPGPERSTVQISGGSMDESLSATVGDLRYRSSYTISGTTLTVDTLCDAPTALRGRWVADFSATANSFAYARPSSPVGVIVRTYTKQ